MKFASQRPRSVQLPFGEALWIVSQACELPGSALSALDARIRQLQKNGITARRANEKFVHLKYGLVEIAGLATAIRLMSAFMAPQVAARYVSERWPQIAPALISGIGTAAPVGWHETRPAIGGRYLVFAGAALAEMGRKAASEGRYDWSLGNVQAVENVDAAAVASAAGAAGVILDTGTYMPIIVRQIASLPMITDDDILQEMDLMRGAF
jgi:hypothetical protein